MLHISAANRIRFMSSPAKQAGLAVSNSESSNTTYSHAVKLSPAHLKANFISFNGNKDISFPIVKNTGITFDLIGGLEQEKALINDFKNDIISTKPICQLKQTCILQGESLSGKSALVEGLINELEKYNIPVIKVDGGDFSEDSTREKRGDYSGSGAGRLANLFWFANKQAETIPGRTAVVFIDNADGLLPIRNSSCSSAKTINANQIFAKFNAEIDAIEKHNFNRVFVIATSSNSTSIDKAAFNRFKRIINVNKPANKDERKKIIESLVDRKNIKINESNKEEIIDRLAQSTGGYLPGRLEHVLDIASEYAQANNSDINVKTAMAAFLDERDGNIKFISKDPDFVKVSIAHELGHAIARVVMNRVADKLESEHGIKWGHSGLINCVNLDPRGEYSASLEVMYNSKNPFSSFEYNFAEMVSNYAAAPCEALFNGLNTNGPEGDQIKTIELAKKAVRNWGMGKTTGKVVPGIDKTSGEWKSKIDSDIELILNTASDAAEEIVSTYKDFILDSSEKYLQQVVQNKENREPLSSAYREPNIIMDKELFQDLSKWEKQIDPESITALEESIIKKIIEIRPDNQKPEKLSNN